MSHLTTYKSEVLVNTKKPLLKKALAELGLEVDYDIKTIRNTWITENVDAGFLKDGKAIALGLKFEKKGAKSVLQVAGDFYGTGVNERTFIDELSQSYKKQDVIYQCESQGWSIDKNDIFVDKNTNEIVIQANRYVV